MRFFRFLFPLLLLLLLAACDFTLAADVTPPPDYRAPVLETQTVVAAYPLVPPNPSDGAAIFAEKCAPCHGPTGKGDGEMSARLPFPAPPIGTAELARQSSPAEWYRIVTLGNMERSMPPFNSLSERQRWDVVAYTFSLSESEESLAQGAELFQANCAGCHGEGGRGDGPQAASLSASPKDFSDQEFMAGRSEAGFFEVISTGAPPAMPAFGGQLSETERWALAGFVRSLSFGGPRLAEAAGPASPLPVDTAQPGTIPATASTPDPGAVVAEAAGSQAELGIITGSVTNPKGGEVPAGLTVFLHAIDGMQTAMTQTTSLREDGQFVFEEIPMPEGRYFLATTEYDGATYGSQFVQTQPDSTTLELPITVYETTTDPSALEANRLHLFLEFAGPQTLRIIELYIISNTGDKTVVAAEEGQPTLTFQLPPGATNLEFQNEVLGGGRFVQTPDGFGDTLAVSPGTENYTLFFAFDLPYERRLELVQPMSIPVNAVVILVPEDNLKIKGESLVDAGVRPVEGVNYQMYNSGSLPAGEELKLTITGSLARSNPVLSAGSSGSLLVGLAALGAVLVLAGLMLYRRNRLNNAEQDELEEEAILAEDELEDPEAIMDAILALDDLYKSGELPHEAYQQRRTELKARLKELMDK